MARTTGGDFWVSFLEKTPLVKRNVALQKLPSTTFFTIGSEERNGSSFTFRPSEPIPSDVTFRDSVYI